MSQETDDIVSDDIGADDIRRNDIASTGLRRRSAEPYDSPTPALQVSSMVARSASEERPPARPRSRFAPTCGLAATK
jgi:hypothetical protein